MKTFNNKLVVVWKLSTTFCISEINKERLVFLKITLAWMLLKNMFVLFLPFLFLKKEERILKFSAKMDYV